MHTNSKSIKVKFQGGLTLKVKDYSIKDLVKLLLNNNPFPSSEPLLISFKGKKLYFDKAEFTAFVNNDINLEELIANQSIDGLYRNNDDFDLGNGIYVDYGSLWSKKDQRMFLIDDDRNIIIHFDKANFIAI